MGLGSALRLLWGNTISLVGADGVEDHGRLVWVGIQLLYE